ncbi:MATE family efflux transporter [Brevibacillus sp. 179-C9.3 HS]|uniref:MATE family efflux transporter n=1 Tax=unclassified Brevibacillus TaxID=2684853 RepID=UPI00399F6112
MSYELQKETSTAHVLKLTFPILMNYMIQFSFTIVDSLMVAPLGVAELGGVGQIGIFYNVVVTFFLGILSIYTPLVGRLNQEQLSDGKMISYFWMTMLLTPVFMLVLYGITYHTGTILLFFQQPVEVSQVGQDYMAILQWAFLPHLAYFCLSQTANIQGKPVIGVYAVIIGNLLNLFLNWIMIYGKWGFPALGVEGSAWATLISRWAMLFVAFVFVNRLLKGKNLLRFWEVKIDWQFYKTMFQKGTPAGFTRLNDWLSSYILVLFVGWGGVTMVAANHVTDLISSTMYMFSQAFGTVTTIIISKQIGAGVEGKELRGVVWRMVKIVMTSTIVVGIVAFLLLDLIFMPFSITPGSDVYQIAFNIMLVHLGIYLFYGLQYAMLAVLDGLLDTGVPSIVYAICSYGIVLPLAYFAVKAGYGAVGVWLADGLGIIILAGIFCHRVYGHLYKKDAKVQIET